MDKEKQILGMARVIYENTAISCVNTADEIAVELYEKGCCKASEVALEAIDNFQSTLRLIFLDMCERNDYNTLNLLQIDNAIEALYDAFVAELKKKYTKQE